MHWQLQVLGRLALSRSSAVITRFESSRTAALLVYLALFQKHPHPRESLIELLWPEEEPEVGRHRLRQAIYSLRRQLEPPGAPPGSVLLADRMTLCLAPESLTCDAVEFERLVRARRYAEATTLYAGELLPGFYDDWVLTERDRLAELFESLPSAADTPEVPEPPAEERAQRAVYLPLYLTAFFGRAEEKEQLRSLLQTHRLVTITGTGGIGKTRLSVETARELSATWDITVFAPLAECAAPSALCDALREACHLPPAPIDPLEQIGRALGNKRLLLILDNFEHLTEAGGPLLVEELLLRLPQMTCLVTSRRLLNIPGEQEAPLAPLPLPTDIDSAPDNPGIALFLSRAQAARPGYRITARTLPALLELCRALEGLPLSIEIAASRIRALSPSEMLSQLEDRFRWLVRPTLRSDKHQRHRSVEAAIEWSWRLLSASEQVFFSRLTLFRGGWTAELAAQVCDAPNVEETLESLVMDSLLLSEETAEGATRFRMLETLRAYARARLDAFSAKETARRHRAALLAFALRASESGDSLAQESDNLIAAIESALEESDTECALSLLAVIEERWLQIVNPARVLAFVRQALVLPDGDSLLRAQVLSVASSIALLTQNRALALAFAEQAIQEAGSSSAERAIALVARGRAGMIRSQEAIEDVRPLLLEAVGLAEKTADRKTLGAAYRLLGLIATRSRDFEMGDRYLRQALHLAEAACDHQGGIYALDNLANNILEQGDLDQALALYAECRVRAERIHSAVSVAKTYQNTATIYARQRRWEESLAAGQECIRRNLLLGNLYILAHALWNIAEPLAYTGRSDRAAQLMSFAHRFWVENYDPLNAEETDFLNAIRAQVAGEVGEAATDRFWSEGEKLSLEEAIRIALTETR